MSPYTDPEPPPLSFADSAWIVKNGSYVRVICLAICLYDHVTTFDLEVELIWKRTVSLVQVLYFTNRYIGDAVFLYAAALLLWVPDHQFSLLYVSLWVCQTFTFSRYGGYFFLDMSPGPSLGAVNAWLSMASLFSYQGIMVHRVYSMCRRQRKVLFIMMGFFAALFITGLALSIVWTTRMTGVPFVYPGRTMRACFPLGWTVWSPALWFIVGAFDVAIFALAVTEGLRYLREKPAPRAARREEDDIMEAIHPRSKESTVLEIFFRDSVLFPFLGILICFFNILAWFVFPVGVLEHTINFAALFSPVLGSRLILNLRDAYYRPFADEIELRFL